MRPTHITVAPDADDALSGIADRRERARVRRLLDNRDRLAAAAAVFEAHHLGDPEELRRVQYMCEAEIAFDHARLYQRLQPEWVRRDAELAHDGIRQRSRECPICNPSNPGLAELRRMAA
jgi:hypothetical protein